MDYHAMAAHVATQIDLNREALSKAEDFLRSLPVAPATSWMRLEWERGNGRVLVNGLPWQQARSEDLYYCTQHIDCLVRQVLFALRDNAPTLVSA